MSTAALPLAYLGSRLFGNEDAQLTDYVYELLFCCVRSILFFNCIAVLGRSLCSLVHVRYIFEQSG